MHEERMLILNMLAEGKISIEEAERLLTALEAEQAAEAVADEDDSDGPDSHFHFEWSFDEPPGQAAGTMFGSAGAMANGWASFGGKQKPNHVRIFTRKF